MEAAVVNGIYSAINSLREDIREELGRQRSTILSFTEATAYLRLAEGTLREFVRLGKIPHHKVGRRIFFNRIDLDQWFEKHRVIRPKVPETTQSRMSHQQSSSVKLARPPSQKGTRNVLFG